MPMLKFITADRARLVWAFGKPYQFHWVTIHDVANTGVAPTEANRARMGPEDYSPDNSPGGGPYQKTQIMLHCTTSNNEARSTISGWQNGDFDGAHIVVERPRHLTAAFSAGEGVPPRADRAGVARLRSDATMDDSERFVDVVLCAEFGDSITHGLLGDGNRNCIGIEHTNAAHTWNVAREETFPAGATLVNRRPLDHNRLFRLTATAASAIGWRAADYQAFHDAQYNSMILMLRAISIEHRIPRQILGTTIAAQAARYAAGVRGSAAERRERNVRVRRFRGIIRHNNSHPNKTCPGIMATNRLFRGIIDEWWLPVEIGGAVRNYYSGPFWDPPYTPPNNGGQPTRPAWFRWRGGDPPTVESTVYRDADLETLTEARSYYNLNQTPSYYTHVEGQQGGTYPIGANRVWHGGVHFEPGAANTAVYAAASGTIVAARVSSHPDTDGASGFGSQRFVLIRHAVYWRTENDPGGPQSMRPGDPVPQRINYAADPTFVFSLYMHLDAIPDLFTEDPSNPRWYNRFLADHAAAGRTIDQATLDPIVGMTAPTGKGRVFNPNVEVSVGDVLGVAGLFARLDDPTGRRRMIHFEIITHTDHEITAVGSRRAEDNDQNAVCDVQMINQELGGQSTPAAAQAAAPRLRDVRVRHRSTWSWDNPALLADFVGAFAMNFFFEHVSRMTWLQDAIAANAELQNQLGNTGFFWHYHPITFMHAINNLILSENREIIEAPHDNVVANVELGDDGFLSDFVRYRPAQRDWQAVGAGTRPDVIAPYYTSSNFTLTRANLACRANATPPPTPHVPAVDPPQSTRFSIALVDIFERIRVRYNASLTVTCAFVCPGHVAEFARCVRGDALHLAAHTAGVAIDFHPQRNAANIRNLWREVRAVCDAYNADAAVNAGTACHGNLPLGYTGVEFKAQSDAVTAHLNTGAAPRPGDVAGFQVHLALAT